MNATALKTVSIGARVPPDLAARFHAARRLAGDSASEAIRAAAELYSETVAESAALEDERPAPRAAVETGAGAPGHGR